MTLTGMKKHVGVLEQAGLVTTEKVGRVRTCRLGPRRLADETAGSSSIASCGPSRFDRAGQLSSNKLKREETADGRSRKR